MHNRVRNACHYMAGVAIQHDEKSRLRYDALRTVSDRLLAMAGAMLRDQTQYDPLHTTRGREVA